MNRASRANLASGARAAPTAASWIVREKLAASSRRTMLMMMTMSAEAIALFARALRRLQRVFHLDDDDDDDDDDTTRVD